MINASQIARSYDSSVADLWRDKSDHGVVFLSWLDRFRLSTAVRRPERGPDARSIVGAKIAWYDTPSAVVGFSADGNICYRIPAHTMFPTHPGAKRQAVPAAVAEIDSPAGSL